MTKRQRKYYNERLGIIAVHLLAKHDALEKQCEELKLENTKLREVLQALYFHCMSGQENYGAIDQAAAALNLATGKDICGA